MNNHFHVFFNCKSKEKMSMLISKTTALFTKEYNKNLSRKGRIFYPNYGSASKFGDKNIRTTIAYILNNPIEKKLCKKADKYRWNFLAYANDSNPFSEKKKRKKYPPYIRCLIDDIHRLSNENKYITYPYINKIFQKLEENYKQSSIELIIDCIIKAYSCLDYGYIGEYFKEYNTLLLALESNTGNDYDIKEVQDSSSDLVYEKLTQLCKSAGFFNSRGNFSSLPQENIDKLVELLLYQSPAELFQVKRFLHLK